MSLTYVEKTKQKFPELSKGLKKVADELLSEPLSFAIHPAKKVGAIIGVSETMVIRFCHEIGYAGYSDLQKELRHIFLDLEKTGPQKKMGETAIMQSFSQQLMADVHRIQDNLEQLDEETLEKAIQKILSSEKILVAGYYHSFAFAHWLSFNLNYILGNASLYRPETDAGLLNLPADKSCLIIFSFYRYAVDTITLAKEAKEKGIPIITITDSRVSPVAEFADIVIPLKVNYQNSFVAKGPVTLSFLNALLMEIIERGESQGSLQPTYKYFIKDEEK
ncbi:putative HTH-type transcriptional regulator YbbH [Planococcus massiliensis]|uniref:Putative HTH-type transcriptional regulator YbbH n=1 Tax=Planococcus massiliensis TaxID=1499687 RepID=A0A098EGT7_9BACL|nr:MurR/RpiR family transcriptional regulator [Planococcus massiliensis]CEG21514.1 putative HTH-type transcriptional regulator YbbH [Planococcus massiliensis]